MTERFRKKGREQVEEKEMEREEEEVGGRVGDGGKDEKGGGCWGFRGMLRNEYHCTAM